MENPIPCYIAGNKGYVWDANGAMRLRKKHRIMGCLVGSVAQFKSQNEVNYLPLELSADEVTLAAQQGWVELLPETSAPVRAAAAAAAAATAAAARTAHLDRSDGRSSANGPSLAADPDWEAAYRDYYSEYNPQVGFMGRFLPVLGAKRRQLLYPQQQKEQRRDSSYEESSMKDPGAAAAPCTQTWLNDVANPLPPAAASETTRNSEIVDWSEPDWRAAVASGGSYTLPMTATVAAAARAGHLVPAVSGSVAEAKPSCSPACETSGELAAWAGKTAGTDVIMADATAARIVSNAGSSRVGWTYPATPVERLRFNVFCDLHRQGFMMTGGVKFGSDMLAYPGDPSLYHAQFTVRPVSREDALNPMMLKAVARGSHAARKHLLLAFYEEQEANETVVEQPPRIRYMSFAPESGFGSKD
ncbi:hypothetical protein Vretimale_11629 [Volvox reticuliferus]|uniref:tRNA-intron lyase n=1 Tax=Volvox reticuliferus TaxID=1737510 RepID=A0A8J4LRY6_9CHLO|nr:hypothetical protein Vretifemale_14788 [Volvox reticuliferus]GIM07518.1 hypothetical protein Vretimale_11629 [Volvox reticuliferus]